MFARVILAASLMALPGIGVTQPVQPKWSNIVNQANFRVDVDERTIKLVVRNNGFEFLTKLRMDFGKPFVVPGKSKAGAYYINEVSSQCKTDTFTIEKSMVYAADGELLASGKDVAVIKNPKVPKGFITIWMQVACGQYKNKRPPTII